MLFETGRPVRYGVALSALLAALALAPCVHAGFGVVEGYHFVIPDVEAAPGQSVEIELQGLHETAVQGFSLAARFPADGLSIERIHIEDTLLEALEIDFFETTVDPVAGTITVGVLLDARPPFDGQLIPNVGRELTYLRVDAVVAEGAVEDLPIRLEDGLGVPPIYNVYSVENRSVPVAEMAEGFVRLPVVEVAAFLRGDSNMDGRLDLSDAVAILEYRFLGGTPPACEDAADTDDDEAIYLSDAIFLLNFLFQGGRRPPRPAPEPGGDPSGDGLDCATPLFWVEVRPGD